MESTPDEFLTTDEVASLLKVSTKTVLRLVRSGQLPACRVGRAFRIRRADLVRGAEYAANGVIYLDDNASNPIDPAVRAAVIEALSVPQANASSSHMTGQAARSRIEQAREQLAELIGARPSDVVFTSGATEANNLVLRGLVGWIGGRRVLISATEHASISRVAEELAARSEIALDIIPVTKQGDLDLHALDSMLSDDVALVPTCAANSETGVLTPLKPVADRVHDCGAIFHCHATQWVGRLPLSMSSSGIDALSLSSHKMCGPQGVGALVLDRALQRHVTAVAAGGGHEDGMRSGSYNVAGIIGLGVAATLAAKPSTSERMLALRKRLTSGLEKAGAIVNGADAERLPNTANVRFSGVPGDVILARTPTVAASLGSACHSGAPDPSPTLLAMGLTRNQANESIRFSVTRFTTAADVDRAVSAITATVHEVRQLTEEVRLIVRLEQACEPTFARHETFHARYSWFRKAFVAAAIDHEIFNREDATVRLGVGKNMVRSLRFWGTAARLIVDEPDPARPRTMLAYPTNVGAAFLGTAGLDPYMEDDATWWWMHWLLISPGSRLPVWWIILHELSLVEFDEATLELACQQVLEGSTWNTPNESSIRKDISAFVRTYSSVSSTRGKFDDQFGCPLRELGLLAHSPTGGHRIATSRPATLPGAIVVAAMLDYAVSTDNTANTISLARLATEAGAPGRAFRLSDSELVELAESVVDEVGDLTLTSPAGAPQLGWKDTPSRIAESLMADLYGHTEPLPPLIGYEARQPNTDPLVALLLRADARNTLVS